MTSSDISKAERGRGIATDAARVVICALKDTSSAFPVLNVTAAVILALWDTVEQFKTNKAQWTDLATLVTERVASIAQEIGVQPAPDFASSIENLNGTLSGILEDVKLLQNRSRFVRTMQVKADKQKIATFHERMKIALDNFNLIANVAVLRAASSPVKESGSKSIDINRTPPPMPVHFYGRDEYVQRIVQLIIGNLETKSGARIAIQGPGGMGKTSVALAVFHDRTTALSFGENRHFVHCEAAESALLLLSAIASSLKMDLAKGQGDALESLVWHLKALPSPLLMILDNAETSWYSSQQALIRTILQHIASIPQVTLVLTMRGTELPNVAAWCTLEPIKELNKEAARLTFLSIAPAQYASQSLEDLLDAVDCMPLAITLLARVSQAGGENPTTLHERWLEEHTDLLQLGSGDREDNIGISIKLSLESQPMRDNPLARRLLCMTSYLPDGIPVAKAVKITGLQANEFRAASHTLKRLSLAHESSTNGHLTTLSPIRAYVRRHHALQQLDLKAVETWYLELANAGADMHGGPESIAALDCLGIENGNLSFVLSSCISSQSITDDLITSVLHFSKFLYFTVPNGDLLHQLLRKSEGISESSKAKILQQLGDIMRKQGDNEGARSALSRARGEFRRGRDHLNAAQCLRSLGNIMLMQDNYEGARETLKEARKELLSVGDGTGAAQCLQSLGEIMRIREDYEGAHRALVEASKEFQSVGSSLGAAQCLRSLGSTMQRQENFGGATDAFLRAREEFKSVGSALGAAQCLCGIGIVKLDLQDYDSAHFEMEKARQEFESVGSRIGIAQCLRFLGEIMLTKRDFAGARNLLREAREHFQSMGDRLSVAQCIRCLGKVMQEEHNYDDARHLYEEAMSIFGAIGSSTELDECESLLRSLPLQI